MTQCEDNLSPSNQPDPLIFRLSVVVKGTSGKHETYHVDLKARKEVAVAYQNRIRRQGFLVSGQRFFRDQIESLLLYKVDADGNKIDI